MHPSRQIFLSYSVGNNCLACKENFSDGINSEISYGETMKEKFESKIDEQNEFYRDVLLVEYQAIVRMEKHRIALGLSQKTCCAAAFPWVESGSQQKTISRLTTQSGKPRRITVADLCGIAKFLDLTPGALLDEIAYDIREGRAQPMPDSEQKSAARNRSKPRKPAHIQRDERQLEIS